MPTAPQSGQTRDGLMFEKRMRRSHSRLCRIMPEKLTELSQKVLCEKYSGPEMSRLCGLESE